MAYRSARPFCNIVKFHVRRAYKTYSAEGKKNKPIAGEIRKKRFENGVLPLATMQQKAMGLSQKQKKRREKKRESKGGKIDGVTFQNRTAPGGCQERRHRLGSWDLEGTKSLGRKSGQLDNHWESRTRGRVLEIRRERGKNWMFCRRASNRVGSDIRPNQQNQEKKKKKPDVKLLTHLQKK